MITLPGASSEPQAHICSASKADNEQIVSVGPLSAESGRDIVVTKVKDDLGHMTTLPPFA
jgi:hypothetical protein